MSIELSPLKRLRCWQESSFCTDGTGTLGNYMDVPAIEGSLTAKWDQAMLDPKYLQQYPHGRATQVLGPKGGELSFSMNLCSTGSAAGNATAFSESPLGRILEVIFGGENLSTGDTIASGGTTTGGVVTDASARLINQGYGVGLLRGASNAYEMRVIDTVSTNTLTWLLALSNAAQTGDVVYGCGSYYLTDNPAQTLQFIVEGSEAEDGWLALGCQLSRVQIETPINELPKITFTFQVAQWLHEAATAATSNGLGSTTTATYVYTAPVYTFGEILVQTSGTTTRPTPLYASSIVWELNLSYAQVKSPSGTNGIYRYRKLHTAPAVTCKIRLPYETADYTTARDAKTLQQIHQQVGNVAGSSFLLQSSTMQIMDVQLVDEGGLNYQEITWAAQLDNQVATGATERTRTPFRLILG